MLSSTRWLDAVLTLLHTSQTAFVIQDPLHRSVKAETLAKAPSVIFDQQQAGR
jgi:hypothetical protein